MSIATKFGWFHVAEPPSSLMKLHFFKGEPLKAVDHEPKLNVLDQEDLLAQGIRTSEFIPNCTQDYDALGSCTAQATTANLSNLLSEADFLTATGVGAWTDTLRAEEFAISFYNKCTLQTGQMAQEWPPTDCGSSGPYIVQELLTMKLIGGDRIATDANSICSLMQSAGLLVGQPWFNSWMEPDAHGFIDGDGSPSAIQAAFNSGVAGGHETFLSAIESLKFDAAGNVDPANTILRGRNSWSRSWGDNGSYRIHLSSYMAVASQSDFRQLVAVGGDG